MKKVFLMTILATSLFACKAPADKTSESAAGNGSSCVKEGPEVDLMKKAITAYSNGDWATMASCFSDTAVSYHNNDSVGMKMSDRIELFKKQRENIVGTVDMGTPNFEVVTVDTKDPAYKDVKWGHTWVRFKFTTKDGVKKSSLTFASLAIKDGKIIWEQVLYDTK
jgi:hypothetical protein